MEQQLVFATNNQHKLTEIKHLFESTGLAVDLFSLSDIGLSGDIREDFTTLHENAHAKAAWVWKRCDYDCFADDTGLEIDGLGGRPGVYSARYAGEGCSFEENMKKVLAEMVGIGERSARFRTVISLIYQGQEFYFEGVVEGSILESPRGKEGFGYDPIFLPNGYDQSFAELPLSIKNRISHRGQAFGMMAAFLREKY